MKMASKGDKLETASNENGNYDGNCK